MDLAWGRGWLRKVCSRAPQRQLRLICRTKVTICHTLAFVWSNACLSSGALYFSADGDVAVSRIISPAILTFCSSLGYCVIDELTRSVVAGVTFFPEPETAALLRRDRVANFSALLHVVSKSLVVTF